MFFFTILLCLAVSSQLGYSQAVSNESASIGTSSANSSSTGTIQVHTVSVGKAVNQFDPSSIEAAVGDIIQFQFFPPNHSVARAEYQIPCLPYEDTGANKVGFWSGFFPVDTILSNPPAWNLTVNDTSPVFFYCAAPGSCQNFAMVGVINPNATFTFAKQAQRAKEAPYMIAPGESLPSAEVSSSMPSSTLSPSSTAPTAATTSQSAVPDHGSKLSSGAIAGIVIGAVVILGLIGTLIYFFGRHRTMIQFLKRDYHQQPPRSDMMSAHHSPFSPQTSSMPYSPGDARSGDFGGQAAPPYPKTPEQPEVAELSSPPLESYRPASPYSDTTAYDGSHRYTSPPPPNNPNYSLDTKNPQPVAELQNQYHLAN